MMNKNSTQINKEVFRKWLELASTREMLRQVAYEFGDLIYYKEGWSATADDDDPLLVLLMCAFFAGQLAE